jgi:hypothetical protein
MLGAKAQSLTHGAPVPTGDVARVACVSGFVRSAHAMSIQ